MLVPSNKFKHNTCHNNHLTNMTYTHTIHNLILNRLILYRSSSRIRTLFGIKSRVIIAKIFILLQCITTTFHFIWFHCFLRFLFLPQLSICLIKWTNGLYLFAQRCLFVLWADENVCVWVILGRSKARGNCYLYFNFLFAQMWYNK